MKEKKPIENVTAVYAIIESGKNITEELSNKMAVILPRRAPSVGNLVVECDSANNDLTVFTEKLKKHIDANHRVAIFYIGLNDDDTMNLVLVSDGDKTFTDKILEMCLECKDDPESDMTTDDVIGACAEALMNMTE